MKKEFLLFGTMVMMLMSCQVFAGSCGPNCEYTIEGGLLTIKGTGENGAGEIEDRKWDNTLFGYNKAITKVVIADGITKIGTDAFTLANLESVYIPDTVKSIGSGAFTGAMKLKNITIPASVTSFGQTVLGYDGSRINLDSITFNADSAKNFSKLSLGWGALGVRANTTIICNECTTEQISALKNKLMTDAYAKSTVTEGNMRIYQKDGEYTLVKDFHGNLLEKRDSN